MAEYFNEDKSSLNDKQVEYFKKAKLLADAELQKSNPRFSSFKDPLWKSAIKLSNLRRFLKSLLTSQNISNYRLNWSSKLAIDTLKQECQKAGCKPYVLVIPNSTYWYPHFLSKIYTQEIQSYAASLNVCYIEINDVIDVDSLSDFANKGVHLSPQGYTKLAKKISDVLKNSKVCND